MVGNGGITSDRSRSKKRSKPDNPSANRRSKNSDDEEDVVFLGSSKWEPEKGGESSVSKKAKRGAQEEDSDDEDVRLLFEEKVASLSAAKESWRIRNGELKNKKEVEKNKNNGKMKALAEEKERAEKKEIKNSKKKENKVVVAGREVGKIEIKNSNSKKKKNNVVVEGKEAGKKEINNSNSNSNSKKKENKVAVEEEDDDESDDREEGSPCKFPMNRIQKIMKDQDSSAKLAQEAVFLANKASEKFLELYCREAYACAFLDHKKQISYDHLASVVSKRKRFEFLSDIIPQKVKAEDALAEQSDK